MYPINSISRDLSTYQGTSNIPQIADGNSLRKVVEWIREDRPAFQQVIVYTLVAIATLALVISVVGIPILVKMVDETNRLNRQVKIMAGDRRIHESIGGSGRFSQLPVLKFSSALDVNIEINPRNMSDSLMRGTDKYGRPFLAMKLHDKYDGQQFVQVIYRKFTHESEWDYSRGVKTIFTGYGIDEDALRMITQVTRGTHQQYRLV